MTTMEENKKSGTFSSKSRIKRKKKYMDGWMTFDFTFSAVFQSYHGDGRLIMKGCVQWSSVYGLEDFASSGVEPVGQLLTH